jgi:tetratricopeptide (TPR) repeat protein
LIGLQLVVNLAKEAVGPPHSKMHLELSRVWQRALFLAIVVLVSGVVIVFSGKAYVAARWDGSSNPEMWVKAAKLEPGNAEYWRHAGLLRQWDVNPREMRDAVQYLQVATKVNSRSSGVWMDLADTYATAGNAEGARAAYERAQSSFPMSAEVAWRYGNFLLYQEDYAEAYPKIRKAIVLDPSLTENALTECWQANPDVEPIVRGLLPDKPEYYVSAMGLFLAQKLVDPAVAVWNRQRERGLPVEIDETVALTDALIGEGRVDEARQIWQGGLQSSNWPIETQTNGSLVMDGGFENEIANGGFDWREIPLSGANFDFDSAFVHAGLRSLRVDFDGTENLDFAHVFQYVAVAPHTRYHFSAFLRTENITTDSGTGFEIWDLRQPDRVHVTTPRLTGTNPWTSVESDFVTGEETRVVKITLRRVPSWKFDNKLGGTVWVDDVALTAAR